MWGLEGDSQEFAFKRFIQGVSDYVDEVISQPALNPPIKLSEEDIMALSRGKAHSVTVISPGMGYTSEPGRPTKNL